MNYNKVTMYENIRILLNFIYSVDLLIFHNVLRILKTNEQCKTVYRLLIQKFFYTFSFKWLHPWFVLRQKIQKTVRPPLPHWPIIQLLATNVDMATPWQEKVQVVAVQIGSGAAHCQIARVSSNNIRHRCRSMSLTCRNKLWTSGDTFQWLD